QRNKVTELNEGEHEKGEPAIGPGNERKAARRLIDEPAAGRYLVSCLVDKCTVVDAAFDLVGSFGPAEGLGVAVPVGQEAGDGLLEACDADETAAPGGLAGNQREPALDQVQPRGAGRGELEMQAWVGGQPLFDHGMLVGVVVVADRKSTR